VAQFKVRNQMDNQSKAYLHWNSPLGQMRLEACLQSAGEMGVTGIYFEGQKYYPDASTATPATGAAKIFLQSLADMLAAYYAKKLEVFEIALAPQGTAFQKTVWAELMNVAHGETIAYGELARRIGNVAAIRAAAAAVGRNPISLVIPCHRIIGANGSLTGYAGGVDRKSKLLALESKQGVNA
jgi:methylated-DNA-[protein]-cysteine S-methyltransferase